MQQKEDSSFCCSKGRLKMTSLFEFSFEPKSEDEIKTAFAGLIQYSRQKGNPRYLRIKDGFSITATGEIDNQGLPPDLQSFLSDFEERGWIKSDNDGKVQIREDLKDYHEPEEVAERFRESIQEYLDQGGHYYGCYNIRTHYSLAYQFVDHPTYLEFCNLQSKVMEDFAKELGLKHFLEVPESRGHKMNLFNTKLARKTVERIAEDIIPMTDFDTVKDYFKHFAFFVGISEYSAKPDIVTVYPNSFCVQCLTQATDVKTVELILSYTGGSWTKLDDHKYTIIYPDGWNYERVQEELTTPEMIDVIFREKERLNRLHGRSVT